MIRHPNKATKLIKIDPQVYRILQDRLSSHAPTLNNVLRELFGIGPSGVARGPAKGTKYKKRKVPA